MKIRTLSIIENTDDDGNVSYHVNGDLPLDIAAKALVIVAFAATPPAKRD